MTRKRHEVLGKRPHVPLSETREVLASNERDYELEITTRPPPGGQAYSRMSYLGTIVLYVAMEHLGFGPIDNLRGRIDRGMDEALDYFCKHWWQANEDDVRALDKSRRNRDLQWRWPLRDAVLLGGLAGRWEDVGRICSWLDETMKYDRGRVDDEYTLLFLCIGSSLRPEPIPQIEKLLPRIKRCRERRPRLLCAAWEAAVSRDQKAFDKAFKQSVAHFLKSEAQDVPNFCFWLALDQSLVWLIAERKGLKFPQLAEELDAAVVRRETIGLA